MDGFLAIRKHYEKILLLVEMTLTRPEMGIAQEKLKKKKRIQQEK